MLVIKNAAIIDPEGRFIADVAIAEGRIIKIGTIVPSAEDEIIDCTGKWLLPGAIDTHVHFRDPGLTHKGDIFTESREALRGGVTSFLDMPNTLPQTTCQQAFDDKMSRAAAVSAANYGFFLGATHDNTSWLMQADYTRAPGVKFFMGASTGNMSVHSDEILTRLLSDPSRPVVVHAEDDECLRNAKAAVLQRFPEGDVPVTMHAQMRPVEACIRASARAIACAEKTAGHLHVAHLSTGEEVKMITETRANVTCDTCPQYLLFSEDDFKTLGSRIKCNPAIKSADNRKALRQAVIDGLIPIIDTDHAPHLLSEKQGNALTAASGMPGVRWLYPLMLSQEWLTPEQVVKCLSQNPAEIYHIDRRGAIKEGYFADLVIINPNSQHVISDKDITAPCSWTPYQGMELSCIVEMTIVNGKIAYQTGMKDEEIPSQGQALTFANG